MLNSTTYMLTVIRSLACVSIRCTGGSPSSVNSSLTERSSSAAKLDGTSAETLYPLWTMQGLGPAARDLYGGLGESGPFGRGAKDLLSSLPFSQLRGHPAASSASMVPFLAGTKPPRGERRNDTCEYCGKVRTRSKSTGNSARFLYGYTYMIHLNKL